MPLYEYQCRACGAVNEIRHGFRETTTEVCSACGGELKRLFNAAGIVFKGSGFYVNDSRKGGSGERASGDGAAAKTGASSDAKGSEAKSDAKPAEAKSSDAKSSDTKKSDTSKSDTAA